MFRACVYTDKSWLLFIALEVHQYIVHLILDLNKENKLCTELLLNLLKLYCIFLLNSVS